MSINEMASTCNSVLTTSHLPLKQVANTNMVNLTAAPQNSTNKKIRGERRNGAIIIDLENIRIAWEKHYHSYLCYFDLCAIVAELQARFLFDCVFIGIYATSTKDIIARNRDDMQRLKNSSRGPEQNPANRVAAQRELYALERFQKTYTRLLEKLKADTKNTEMFDPKCFADRKFSIDNLRGSVRFDRLGGTSKESRQCQVKLEEFGLKQHQGRMVQRGCDAAIVHDLTIMNFNQAIDTVWCISGDSDFVDTLEKNAKKQDAAGRSWNMLAFTESYGADIKYRLSRERYHPTGPLVDLVQYEHANFFPIERVLPGVNPMQMLLRGKRSPTFDRDMGRKHQYLEDNSEAKCAAAAEARWVELEQSSKNDMRPLVEHVADFHIEFPPPPALIANHAKTRKGKHAFCTKMKRVGHIERGQQNTSTSVEEPSTTSSLDEEINLSDEEIGQGTDATSHGIVAASVDREDDLTHYLGNGTDPADGTSRRELNTIALDDSDIEMIEESVHPIVPKTTLSRLPKVVQQQNSPTPSFTKEKQTCAERNQTTTIPITRSKPDALSRLRNTVSTGSLIPMSDLVLLSSDEEL